MNYDQMAWDMFFANLVGIQYHPANPTHLRLPLEELAEVADEMMRERNRRCPSSQPPL